MHFALQAHRQARRQAGTTAASRPNRHPCHLTLVISRPSATTRPSASRSCWKSGTRSVKATHRRAIRRRCSTWAWRTTPGAARRWTTIRPCAGLLALRMPTTPVRITIWVTLRDRQGHLGRRRTQSRTLLTRGGTGSCRCPVLAGQPSGQWRAGSGRRTRVAGQGGRSGTACRAVLCGADAREWSGHHA